MKLPRLTRRRAIAAVGGALLLVAAALAVATRDGGGKSHLRASAPTTSSSSSTSTSWSTPAVTTSPKAAGGKATTTTVYLSSRGDIALIGSDGAGGAVFVMHADGSNRRKVAAFEVGRTAKNKDGPWFGGDHVSGVGWNPSGDLLAITEDGKYGGGVEVVRPDGSGRHTLVYDTTALTPRFSPDGRSIVYGNPGPKTGNPSFPPVIAMVGVNGENPHRVTPDGVSGTSPDWSPDGTTIVYVRSADASNSSQSLWLMNPDGSNQRSIPTTVSPGTTAWSPDGTWIAISSIGTGGTDLYELHPDGSALTQLTTDHISSSPAWSPDGTSIAFWRMLLDPPDNSRSDIWVIGADGRGTHALTTDGASASPAWD